MAFKFKKWLFDRLPYYFEQNDTYKNSDGEGLLERYLSNFGSELDDNLVDFIHTFTDILDLKRTPNKFLPFLGFLVGSPPDIDGTPTTYRRLLGMIIDIYQIKGTICAYKLLFNLLGLDCAIIEYPPKKTVRYDTGAIYDDPSHNVLYDLPCEPCREYDIAYWNRNDICSTGTVNPVAPNILDQLRAVICFIQPIDCKLINLSRAVRVCEDITQPIDNEVTIVVARINSYDDGLIYDDVSPKQYDSYIVVNTYTFTF